MDLLGDDQRSARIRELTRRLELATGTLEAESYEWRTRALVTWATGVVQAPELAAQRGEIELMKLALEESEAENTRLTGRVKALQRRLRESTATESGRAEATSRTAQRVLDKAARSLARRGR